MIHFVIMLTRVPFQDCGPVGAVSTLVDKMRKERKTPERTGQVRSSTNA